MKQIKQIKQKEQEIPELIWGDKYTVTHETAGLDVGDTVVLVNTTPDCDGEVRIITAGWGDFKYIEPQFLLPLGAEPTESTVAIEFTESELGNIVDAMGEAKAHGYKEFSDLYDILQGAF